MFRLEEELPCKVGIFAQSEARWLGRWGGKSGCRHILSSPPLNPLTLPEIHGFYPMHDMSYALSSLVSIKFYGLTNSNQFTSRQMMHSVSISTTLLTM